MAAPPVPPDDPMDQAAAPDQDPGDDGLVDEELLVEEISIDGMCGVY